MKILYYPKCVRVNAPELKENPEFVNWLNQAAGNPDPKVCARAATWHRPEDQTLTEYSDVMVFKDTGHEGSNSDMPEAVWNKLCQLVGKDYDGLISISFLENQSVES